MQSYALIFKTPNLFSFFSIENCLDKPASLSNNITAKTLTHKKNIFFTDKQNQNLHHKKIILNFARNMTPA
jgi:hypothetical protein